MIVLLCIYLAYASWCFYTIYLIAESNSKSSGLGNVTFELFCRWVSFNGFHCLNIYYVRTVLRKTLEMNKVTPVVEVPKDKSPLGVRISLIGDTVRREIFCNIEYRNSNPYVDILYTFIPGLDKPWYYTPPTELEQDSIRVVVNNALLRHCSVDPLPVARVSMDDFNYRENLKLLLLYITSKTCQHEYNDRSVVIDYFDQFNKD